MSAFEDARSLVDHSQQRLPVINRLYRECISEKDLKSSVCIEVKGFLEHLRSALDYCVSAIYKKHGNGKPSYRPYFPYAGVKDTEKVFRTLIIEKAIPGVAAACPAIVDVLSYYQCYGSTGNWMPIFMELNNENKHREFSSQAIKEYTLVNIRLEIPAGGSETIELRNIQLGERSGYKANAFKLTTYEFISTGALAYPFLDLLPRNIFSLVNDLEAAFYS